MERFKRTLAGLLTALMLLSALSAWTVLAVMPATAEDNIASDQPVVCKAFDPAFIASHSPRAFTEGSPIGMRMNFGAPFTKFTVCMPTWSDKNTSLTLSIYKWNVDFDTTRKAEPLATRKIANHPDNGHAELSFNELPAGEYLICIDEFSGGRLGAWQMDSHVGKGYVYEGVSEKAVDWEINVTFSKTPVEAFLPLESVMNTLYGDHTPPAEAETPENALVNTHKVMPDTWVFTDGLGRTSYTYEDVGGPKDDKTVAMFYWTWHVDLAGDQPLNVTDFVKQYPDAVNDYDHEAWPTGNTAYFWNEPIWGYYRTNDPWVLRRQAELLANAGVDTIFTDNTNGNYTWRSSYIPLYETWSDAQESGAVNVPKVSYLLPFASTTGSVEQIESIYLDIYRSGKYQNLWFYWDGKPMLMAHNNSFTAQKTGLHKEIMNFFTFRPGYAGYVNKGAAGQYGSWGWLSITPQAAYYAQRADRPAKRVEQTTVGVAMNHSYSLHSIAPMNGTDVMGRSYTTDFENRYATEGDTASQWGHNFSEQWENALSIDPKTVFVTGWNEWTAGRHETWADIENAFPDQFNDEFSRDLEPTKGELKDHYYYLLVNYVRKFKGVNPIPEPGENRTMNLADGRAAWRNVEPYYAAYIGNTDDRDAKGYGSLHYTETSGRNDIIGARIARDDENVWFYVECNQAITSYTDNLWMNLYIDADQENHGWETFDYIVNKSAASADTLVLERFTGNGYETEKVADVRYKLDGKGMIVEIPKSALGLTGNDYTINFAWTDNVHDEGNYETFSGDIMDFYISGDVAPGARFKYSYISTTENSGVETESETSTETETESVTETDSITETETESVTETETDVLTETTSETETDAEFETVRESETTAESAPAVESETTVHTTQDTVPDTTPIKEEGCASSVGVLLLPLFAATAILVRKKKD